MVTDCGVPPCHPGISIIRMPAKSGEPPPEPALLTLYRSKDIDGSFDTTIRCWPGYVRKPPYVIPAEQLLIRNVKPYTNFIGLSSSLHIALSPSSPNVVTRSHLAEMCLWKILG
jgi:hypothetical protein